MKTILPADLYTVVSKTFLNEQDRKILTMLYQPITGPLPILLYYTLWADLDKTEIMSASFTHHHLMTSMRLRLDDILEARQKLEAIGLMKTYFKDGELKNYVYELYSPISAYDFFNHPILNVVLYNNIGKKEYDKLISYFKIPKIHLQEYEDITSNFNDVYDSVAEDRFEGFLEDIKRSETRDLNIQNHFDFNLLLESLPNFLTKDRILEKNMKELLLNLSFIYHIDELRMANLIRAVLNEKGNIDKKLLRKKARDLYQFETGGMLPTLAFKTQPEYLKNPLGDTSPRAKMIYTFETTTPYDFLRSKYKTGEPTRRDLSILESLLIDQKLKPGVVNVLMDYVLRVNHQKLNKDFIETIAGQWARLKIETVEEAMTVAEKEHKKYQKSTTSIKSPKTVTKEVVPDWFDKEIKKETLEDEEKKELEEMLKEFAR